MKFEVTKIEDKTGEYGSYYCMVYLKFADDSKGEFGWYPEQDGPLTENMIKANAKRMCRERKNAKVQAKAILDHTTRAKQLIGKKFEFGVVKGAKK